MAKNPKQEFSPLLHLTYHLQQLTDENLLADAGVGLSQARIMSVLSAQSAKPQNLIAHELQQTESNVSRQVKNLKSMGLVSITKNKRDGRQKDVKLTTKGSAKYRTVLKIMAAQEAELLKLLSRNEIKSFDHATKNLMLGLNVIASSTRKL